MDNKIEPTQQKATEKFNPSSAMVKWFETALELGYTASISSVAEKAKLDRTNWYRWLPMPGFVDWWDSQWQQYLKVHRWKLDAMGIKQAERNYDYWHDMMIRVGNLSNKPDSQNNIQINIVRDEIA